MAATPLLSATSRALTVEGWPGPASSSTPLCSINRHADLRGWRGFSTKLHALVTEPGRLVRYVLTGGEASDIAQAKELVSKDITGRGIVGDRAYDSNEFVSHLRQRDFEVVIRARANRVVPRGLDKKVYRLRNVIERWFGRLKQFRRIATRYDKTERSYRGFVALGASELALSGWGA